MINKILTQAALAGIVCLPLAAQVSVPRVGTFRYPDGSLHGVQGLTANMIISDLHLDSAQAASFSDQGGLVWQAGMVRLLTADFSAAGEFPAPANPASKQQPVLEISSKLTSALAWLPHNHNLLHWNGTQFDSFQLAPAEIDGTVTSLQSVGDRQARLIVLRADDSVLALTFSLRTGGLVNTEVLPGVRGPAFIQGSLIVYSMEGELVADDLRGSRRSIAFPGRDVVMERMSNNWLHLYSARLQQHWAVHVTPADFAVSMLPGHKLAASVALSAVPEVKK